MKLHGIYRHALCLLMITTPVIANKNPTPAQQQGVVTAEIALGELIDKITILEIKMVHIRDAAKLRNIKTELDSLRATYAASITPSSELEKLTEELHGANAALWVIEDLIRDKEREQTFDGEFIKLARSVYYTNDARCKAKRGINDLLGSKIVEEKSYTDYISAVDTSK